MPCRIIPKLSVLKQQQQQTKTTALFSHRSVAQGCKCGLAGSSPKVSVIQWLNWEGPTTEWLLAGLSSFFFDIFIDYAITLVPFPPLHSTPSCPPPLSHSPPREFMSMGHTYKFFGFYNSYTILTLSLSIFHLSFMLLILCTFPPIPLPLPC